MSEPRKPSRWGLLWLALIFTPVALMLAGVVTLFVWKARTGSVAPKWQKPAPSQTVPGSNPPPATATANPAPGAPTP